METVNFDALRVRKVQVIHSFNDWLVGLRFFSVEDEVILQLGDCDYAITDEVVLNQNESLCGIRSLKYPSVPSAYHKFFQFLICS